MKKSDYRDFFASVKPFVKINYFLKRAGISSGAFSLFMRGESHDYCLSVESFQRIYDDLTDVLGKIA